MRSPFFTTSILIAFTIHVFLLILIIKLGPQIPERTEKSIPVLLVSPSQPSSLNSIAPQSQRAPQQDTVTTTNESRYTRLKNQQKETTRTTSNQSKQAANLPELPSITTPNLNRSRRTDTANSSLQDLFGQKESKISAKRKQLSRKDLPNLSDFELSLLQRLSKRDLYSEYHKVLEQHERSQIDFSIEIILFANGAIKKAKIHHSSQVPQIDELAIRTAYNASPYDRPPSEDIEKGFKYIIPISYQKQ